MDDLVKVEVTSMFGRASRQPLVTLAVGEEEVRMSPENARKIASMLMEAAEAALSDAFLFSFISEFLETNDEAAVSILREFRKWRFTHSENTQDQIDKSGEEADG